MAARKKGGRPFGESSSSAKGFMTRYTRSSGGSKGTMKFAGRPARSNGMKNLKGRASANTYGGPSSRARKG